MKMKKLLASALAAALVVSSMVGTIVTSAATKVGTITAATVNALAGQTDTVEAEVNITFDKGVVAPHNFITVALAGYELTDVALGDVTYATDAQGKVSIDKEYCDLDAGKILIEAPVDATAPTVTAITLTVTFADVDDVDTAAGEYDIVVNADDMSDVDEADLTLDAVNGKLIVTAPHEHTPAEAVVENNVAATCYAEGSYDSVVYCADETCKAELSRTPVTVEKIAHTPAEAVVENNVDATCYAEGSYDSVVYCAVEACKAEISRTPVEVPVTDHTPAEAVVENKVDATCYAEGSYDSVVYCAVEACKHEISRTPVTVEKIAHTPAAPVEENRVEAKPGVAGSYDSVVYCAVEACKAEISRTTNEIPALPEAECNHVGATFVSAINPTDAKSGTITIDCPECGEVTLDLYYHKYARAGYSSANAEEQTLISFSAFYEKDFNRIDANASWDAMFITVDQSRNGEAIGTKVYTYADVETGVSNGEKAYKVYYGLPAYAYVDDMAASVYLYDSVADKWYSGPQNKTSLKALAESIIPGATGVKKSMWVDLLNYGAAAQKNFKVNDADANLANAGISAYQDAATTPKAYTNNLSVSAGTDPTPFYYYMFTGVVESKITLRTYFRFPNNYTGMYKGETGENIKAVATWTSYTGETKTYVAELGEDGFNLLEGRNDRWDFYLPLGAPDLRANITFTIVYGEEEVVVSPVATCSFESYVADNYASGSDEFKALCDAMMAFGDSANAYLTQG